MKDSNIVMTASEPSATDVSTIALEVKSQNVERAKRGQRTLHKDIRKQAMDEIHHANWVIEQLQVLDRAPTAFKPIPLDVGTTLRMLIDEGNGPIQDSVNTYNDAIGFRKMNLMKTTW